MNYQDIKIRFFNYLNSKGTEYIKPLIHTYNTIHTRLKLIQILTVITNKFEFNTLSKFELHILFNDIMCKYCVGEQWFKYKLFNRDLMGNAISAYELKVNKSRIDYVSINGNTMSYEIKSNIDNLQKLPKQITDYEKLFEYNNVVIDIKHLEKCLISLPLDYGVMTLEKGELIKVRGAKKNNLIDPVYQLNIMTQKELKKYFNENENNIDLILSNYNNNKINDIFKNVLKARFTKRFNFIRQHHANILPIDYQFFFNKNIPPTIIYNL